MVHAASATTAYGPGIGQVTIDVLPDNALLEIFDFYKNDLTSPPLRIPFTWRWITMIQVCRRWRTIIFGSPRRLNLRLVCTNTTPARTSLDIWPPFPLVIYCEHMHSEVDEKGLSNIIASFEHSDRISEVHIRDIDASALVKLAAVMEEPFPILRQSMSQSQSFLRRSSSWVDLPHVWKHSSYPAFHS